MIDTNYNIITCKRGTYPNNPEPVDPISLSIPLVYSSVTLSSGTCSDGSSYIKTSLSQT